MVGNKSREKYLWNLRPHKMVEIARSLACRISRSWTQACRASMDNPSMNKLSTLLHLEESLIKWSKRQRVVPLTRGEQIFNKLNSSCLIICHQEQKGLEDKLKLLAPSYMHWPQSLACLKQQWNWNVVFRENLQSFPCPKVPFYVTPAMRHKR